jgi:hypothetical protein
MTVTTTHAKNPAEGWDISATAKADPGEKIVRVQIIVNGFSAYDKTFIPPISNWQEQLTQVGQFPGDSLVQVIATNEQGDDTESDDSWTDPTL